MLVMAIGDKMNGDVSKISRITFMYMYMDNGLVDMWTMYTACVWALYCLCMGYIWAMYGALSGLCEW